MTAQPGWAGGRSAVGIVAAAAVALPWLNPFAPGPSATVMPWLVAALCALALALLAVAHGGRPPARLVLGAAMLALWAVLATPGWRPEPWMLASALAVVLAGATIPAQDGAESLARMVQGGWLAAACISAVMGLVQYFGQADSLAPLVSVTAPGEAFANLRQRNQFASLTWIGAAVLLWGGLALPWRLRAALMVLLAAASAASVSRTGLVEGMALTALVLLWAGPERRERLTLCAIAAAAYVAAAVLLPLALHAWTGANASTLWVRLGTAEGCASRLVLWGNVLHLIAQQPMTGWGWGELDYAHFMTLYEGARFCDILDNAHNLPLHLAVELGLPAALLVCGGALAWAWLQQPWRETGRMRQLAWALLTLLAIHSLLEYPLWYGPFQITLGVALGWLMVPAGDAQASRGGARPLARPALVVGALAGAVGYAAWDYLRVSQVYLPPEQRIAIWREQPIEQARRSWLFSGQAQFAELTLASVRKDNAAWVRASAETVLRYSPEPKVIERAIESATLTGDYDDALLHLARYRAAFPADYAAWRSALKRPGP
jgi:O-antigen ligase